MIHILKQGAVTYAERNAQTTIDLCWIMLGLVDRLINSKVDQELDHDSDHFPITTMLNLSAKKQDKEPKRNWKRLDDSKLCELSSPHTIPCLVIGFHPATSGDGEDTPHDTEGGTTSFQNTSLRGGFYFILWKAPLRLWSMRGTNACTVCEGNNDTTNEREGSYATDVSSTLPAAWTFGPH